MTTVTIPKTEYQTLKKESRQYRRIAGQFFKNAQKDSVGDIVSDFKRTESYSEDFLNDLETGLKRLHSSKEWKSK